MQSFDRAAHGYPQQIARPTFDSVSSLPTPCGVWVGIGTLGVKLGRETPRKKNLFFSKVSRGKCR